eukprot:3373734-Pleurochrysis_carterae.AAC.1
MRFRTRVHVRVCGRARASTCPGSGSYSDQSSVRCNVPDQKCVACVGARQSGDYLKTQEYRQARNQSNLYLERDSKDIRSAAAGRDDVCRQSEQGGDWGGD